MGKASIDRSTTEMKGSIGVGFQPSNTFKEITIETALNRKRNVDDMRNGFEYRRMGDKCYR